MIRSHKIALMLALFALALVAAPTAMAASPAQEGYDETTVLNEVKPTPPTPQPESQPAPEAETAPVAEESPVAETAPVAVESAAPAPTSSESSLPFTGADLGILVLMGVLLGGTGLVLRRVVRQRPTA